MASAIFFPTNIYTMKQILDNQYLITGLYIATILYASTSRVKLPTLVRDLFKNDLFRVLFLSLLLIIRFDQRPSVALLVVLMFMHLSYQVNQEEVNENIEAFSQFKRIN